MYMKVNIDKAKGCFYGLAVGDALGTTNEFGDYYNDEPIDDMNGGGPFNLKSGEWTDDTSMMLCLAQSLIANQGKCIPEDQLKRYSQWYRNGENSSNGKCFDIQRLLPLNNLKKME